MSCTALRCAALTYPLFLHSYANSQIPPKGPTQMREMSKGGETSSGSNPAGVAPLSSENQTGHSTAPEQSAVPAHTEGPEKRLPRHGDSVEVELASEWYPAFVVQSPSSASGVFKVRRGSIGAPGSLYYIATEGSGWRWPAAASGGGSADDVDDVLERHVVQCQQCQRLPIVPCSVAKALLAGPDAASGGGSEDPAPLPPIRRCAERVSEPGDAIEDCGTVIGREVQCIVCKGARCYVHCGCLSHYQGARTVSRGSNGKFEWCVWELEHGFRGQLFWHTEGGISLLGTHGGSSSEAVGAILLRNLEKIQAQHVRGDVVIGGASARTNEAAGEVVDRDPVDPEAELRQLDAKVVLLLENAKRLYDASALAMQRQRLRMVDICVGWVRTTERTWRDLADDGEQNPRLVFQCKELHDQQVADLFFQIGQLFNGGES